MEAEIEQYLEHGEIPTMLETLLADPAARNELYRVIVHQPVHPFRSLLLRLLEEEIRFREALWNGSATDAGDYCEGIYHCAFLLSRCGDPSDTAALWKVQYLNQDIGELYVGNFVGAGIKETLDFLDRQTDESSMDIAAYIRDSLASPAATEWIERWEDGCRSSISGT